MYHTIMIQTTNACNMNCPYCFIKQRPASHITVEDVEAQLPYVQRVSRLMDPTFTEDTQYVIDYFGGEPLLNFDTILALHDRVFSRNVVQFHSEHVVTNALLLTWEKLDELNKRNIYMYYSFDGIWDPPESIAVHEQFLAEGLLKPDAAKTMIAPEHAGDIVENYLYFVDQLGWTCPGFMFIHDDVWSRETVDIAKQQLHKLVDIMVARTLASADKCYCVKCINLAIADMIRCKLHGKRDFMCFAGRYGMLLTPDRKIYPCPRIYMDDKYMLVDANTGKVFEDQIRKLVYGFNTSNMSECDGCEIQYCCKTGCAYTQYLFGEEQRMKPVPVICELIKACYAEAMRYCKLLAHNAAFKKMLANIDTEIMVDL